MATATHEQALEHNVLGPHLGHICEQTLVVLPKCHVLHVYTLLIITAADGHVLHTKLCNKLVVSAVPLVDMLCTRMPSASAT